MSFLDKVEQWFENLVHDDAHAVVTVKKGDSLWKIAEGITGDGSRWHEIADLNQDRGFTPDYTIFPGETLNIPLDWVK